MGDPLLTGKLFNRFAQVMIATASGTEITLEPDFHVQFKCTRSNVSAFPNGLELTISNLSQQTRNSIVEKGGVVTLDAGYDSAHGIVFRGNIRTVDHVKHGPDWNTVIQCGSGEVAWQYAKGKQVLKGPVAKTDVIEALLRDLGLGTGGATGFANLQQPFFTLKSDKKGNRVPSQTTYVNGYSYHGSPGKEISKIAESLGYIFTIDNNEPVFSPYFGGVVPTETIYVLNPETGLLGSPIHGSPNAVGAKIGIVKAKCLMLPQLRPGWHIQLQHDWNNSTRRYNSDGIYYIQKIICEGDTAGNEWGCDLELKLSRVI